MNDAPPAPGSRVSVVIAARGPSAHLTAAIASALAQQEAAEIVVALDPGGGDPDGALPADPRIRRVRSSAGGPAAVRNAGIDAARFPVVAFLDDDDAWRPGHLAAAVAALDRHPAAILVAMDAYLFDDPRDDGGSPLPSDPSDLPRFLPARAEGAVSIRELLLANVVLTPAVVLRKDRLRPSDRFDPVLPVMEDWDLWLRLARAGEIVVVPTPTVVVRRRPGSASRNLEGMASAALRVLEREAASGMLRRGLSEAEIRKREGRLWHDLAYARLRKADGPGAREALRQSRRRLPLLFKNYIYWLASYLPFRWGRFA